MSYPFVASHTDLGPARGPRRAFVVHMAEGGGTVGYLSRPNTNDVSVHFVIEGTGRIVQMLKLDHMHSSIRTTAIRMSDDADGFYGRTAAKAVMGEWADVSSGTLGPNHASIAVEIEGFAIEGPNEHQEAALVELMGFLEGRFPGIRALGHRDFASYKACPGRKIDWASIGGHGVDMPGVRATAIGDTVSGIFRVTQQAGTIPADGSPRGTIGVGAVRHALGPYALTDLNNRKSWLITEDGKPSYVADVYGTFSAGSAAPTDCTDLISAAVAADRTKARIVYDA